MKIVRPAATVIARFFLSLVFLTSGINKLFHWRESEQLLMNVLSDWQSQLSFSEVAQNFFTTLILFVPFLLIAMTLIELLGSLLLLLGVHEKVGAVLLFILLIPTTPLFHPFWFVENSMRELEQTMFLNNLAIMGGLLLVVLCGASAPQKRDAPPPNDLFN